MRILNRQEILDILVGCTILGTGGGGSLKSGTEAVEEALAAGLEFKMLDFSEVEDEKYYVNPYFTGTIVPEGQQVACTGNELPDAVKALEKYMNVDFHGVVSIEYGGGNTGTAMAAAAKLGKFIVDADAAGRAVPELQFSTYYVRNQPIDPMALTTVFGDEMIVQKATTDPRAEAIARFVAVGSGGLVGTADHPIVGANLKTSVIPNALSYAESVGRARREAEENGTDPIEAILRAGNGKLLFQGTVTNKSNWWLEDGFTLGNIYLTDAKDGGEVRVWYKNENMVCWKNDEVVLTCPDLICVVETATGMPVTNPNCTEGKELSILGFKCHDLWREERGIDILNPKFFGFDMEIKDL